MNANFFIHGYYDCMFCNDVLLTTIIIIILCPPGVCTLPYVEIDIPSIVAPYQITSVCYGKGSSCM